MAQAAQRLLKGDRRALSQVISILERGDSQAADIMKAIDAHTGRPIPWASPVRPEPGKALS